METGSGPRSTGSNGTTSQSTASNSSPASTSTATATSSVSVSLPSGIDSQQRLKPEQIRQLRDEKLSNCKREWLRQLNLIDSQEEKDQSLFGWVAISSFVAFFNEDLERELDAIEAGIILPSIQSTLNATPTGPLDPNTSPLCANVLRIMNTVLPQSEENRVSCRRLNLPSL